MGFVHTLQAWKKRFMSWFDHISWPRMRWS